MEQNLILVRFGQFFSPMGRDQKVGKLKSSTEAKMNSVIVGHEFEMLQQKTYLAKRPKASLATMLIYINHLAPSSSIKLSFLGSNSLEWADFPNHEM